MQTLVARGGRVAASARILGLGNYIERLGRRIDDGRADDPDVWGDVIRENVTRIYVRFSCRNQCFVPVGNTGASIRVEGVDTIAGRSNKDDVVGTAIYGQIGNPERLRVGGCIYGTGK